MKKEQIIEILGKIGTPISLDDVDSPTFWLEEAADAILTLPLEVPSDEEIACEIIARFLSNPHANQRANYQREKRAFANSAMWMRDEITKRNQNNL